MSLVSASPVTARTPAPPLLLSRGRVATLSAYRHFGLATPAAQRDLLSDA